MTWISPANVHSGRHIDYILASHELALQATQSQVVSVPGLVTDHQLLFTSFSTGPLTKCVRRSVLCKSMKGQSVWNFGAMTQEG